MIEDTVSYMADLKELGIGGLAIFAFYKVIIYMINLQSKNLESLEIIIKENTKSNVELRTTLTSQTSALNKHENEIENLADVVKIELISSLKNLDHSVKSSIIDLLEEIKKIIKSNSDHTDQSEQRYGEVKELLKTITNQTNSLLNKIEAGLIKKPEIPHITPNVPDKP